MKFNKIKYAYQKGYRIDKDGILLNKNKEKVKGFIKSSGYRFHTIRFNNGFKTFAFHRLQAFQKFGDEIFKPDIEVRHLDGNALNNSLINIEIGSRSQNMMDIPKNIRIKKASLANLIHSHKEIIEDRKKG